MTVTVYGHGDQRTGHGMMTDVALRAIRCQRPQWLPGFMTYAHGPFTYTMERVFSGIRTIRDNEMVLQISPPSVKTLHANTVIWTMTDSTEWTPDCIENLSTVMAVIVPCKMNADSLKAAGVKNVRTIPLGFNEYVFIPSTEFGHSGLVFGAGGYREGAGQRKNLQVVIDAFLKAFPPGYKLGVQLKIKELPNSGPKLDTYNDPRISIISTFIDESEMAEWYRSLDAFVSASGGEGFGLMPLEALACGRPVIAPFFGGHMEYLNDDNAFDVPFGLVDADDRYYAGQMCSVRSDDLAMVMDQFMVAEKAHPESIARSVSRFRWDWSMRVLCETLDEYASAVASKYRCGSD